MAADTVWLDTKRAAAYCCLDVVTLRRAVHRGDLQAYAVNGGTRVRFRTADLERWLTAHPVKTVAS